MQGSLSALQKKTGRDKKEAQAELERTREWVHKKIEGEYLSALTITNFTQISYTCALSTLLYMQIFGRKCMRQTSCCSLKPKRETF